DFDCEIIIGEDCSSDNTRQIVEQYRKKHSNKIRVLFNNENIGMQRNFVQTLQACQGEYVAILEGDDYWTSRDKLQQQVAFLNAHPDHAMCFHNVRAFRDDDPSGCSGWLLCPDDQKQNSTIEDLLRDNFVPTCTVMFRNGLV